MQTFTKKAFDLQYPNDDACLKAIFMARYGGKVCPFCHKAANFYKLTGRKCYLCSSCKEHVYPLADTIFHKSETSLKSWFETIYKFANARNGVSAKELQRDLGCTYKTAWRMAKQIRLLFSQNNILSGTIEADETYVGGKRRGSRGRGAEGKTAVFGLAQRKGKVKAQVVENVKAKTIIPIMANSVSRGSQIYTDEFPSYYSVSKLGYKHDFIQHAAKEYARGQVHTNNIEGFWSQLKRSINGTYHAVSAKYLQHYVDEFAYRYNHRHASAFLFDLALQQVVRQVG